MRWLAWFRRRPKAEGDDMPATTATPAAPSEETVRAQQSAREAALHLYESRARRPEVARRAREIGQLNRENGFAAIIREAFGRNT